MAGAEIAVIRLIIRAAARRKNLADKRAWNYVSPR